MDRPVLARVTAESGVLAAVKNRGTQDVLMVVDGLPDAVNAQEKPSGVQLGECLHHTRTRGGHVSVFG